MRILFDKSRSHIYDIIACTACFCMVVDRKVYTEMNDLIRRKDAIDALHKKCVTEGLLDEFDTEDTLRKLPSAEPERTAKVETVEKPNVYRCSECGQYFHSTAWGSPVMYCSRCGAKLDWIGNE